MIRSDGMMEIRRATLQDAPEIFTCCVNAFKHYILEMGKAPAPMLTDYSVELQQHDVFVACEDGEVTGFVFILPDEQADSDCMWLDVLAVDPKYQKKGIGRLLLDYTEDFMKAQGKRECRLYTNVKFTNTKEIYLHCGYEIYERALVNGYDRYYMKKTLTVE